MSEHLEDQLHRLAADVSAPASDGARQAVGRRTRVLRRRRRARRAALGGVVAAGLVVGVLVLRPGDAGENGTVATRPDPGDASLPAWTVDLDGWEVSRADIVTDDGGDGRGSLQVFRRPGELTGPTVAVRHVSASDVLAPPEDTEAVAVAGADGHLRRLAADRYMLWWSLGDSHVELRAFGLSEDEVRAFADGLTPRDPDGMFSFPGDGDVLGFDATELPAGLEEQHVAAIPAEQGRVRLSTLVLDGDGSQLVVEVTDAGQRVFEDAVADRLVNDRTVHETEVDGHPALASEAGDRQRHVIWRQGETVTVHVTIEGPTGPGVEDVVGALRPMSEDEWRSQRERLDDLDPPIGG